MTLDRRWTGRDHGRRVDSAAGNHGARVPPSSCHAQAVFSRALGAQAPACPGAGGQVRGGVRRRRVATPGGDARRQGRHDRRARRSGRDPDRSDPGARAFSCRHDHLRGRVGASEAGAVPGRVPARVRAARRAGIREALCLERRRGVRLAHGHAPRVRHADRGQEAVALLARADHGLAHGRRAGRPGRARGVEGAARGRARLRGRRHADPAAGRRAARQRAARAGALPVSSARHLARRARGRPLGRGQHQPAAEHGVRPVLARAAGSVFPAARVAAGSAGGPVGRSCPGGDPELRGTGAGRAARRSARCLPISTHACCTASGG